MWFEAMHLGGVCDSTSSMRMPGLVLHSLECELAREGSWWLKDLGWNA